MPDEELEEDDDELEEDLPDEELEEDLPDEELEEDEDELEEELPDEELEEELPDEESVPPVPEPVELVDAPPPPCAPSPWERGDDGLEPHAAAMAPVAATRKIRVETGSEATKLLR